MGRLWELHHQGRPGRQRDSGALSEGRRDRRRVQVRECLEAGQGRDARGDGRGWRAASRSGDRPLPHAQRLLGGPAPRALAVPRLLSPEKAPAGKGKKALARLTWGRSTCCKSWGPGCQQILSAAGSGTRGPQHLRVLHASPTAPRKGGRGGVGGGQAPGAWLSEAGSTGPVCPGPGRNTQQLREREGCERGGAVRGVRSGPTWLRGGPACLRRGGKAPSSGPSRKQREEAGK